MIYLMFFNKATKTATVILRALPIDRKLRKNRARLLFTPVLLGLLFIMSDLGEEFAKISIQWLNTALAWPVYEK